MSSRSASAASRSGICLRGDRALDVARVVIEPVVADRASEVLRRDVLELVRLVDDGVAARRNHFAERALPHRGVGAEQVVIDDDDVGLRGALAHLRDEAVVELRAVGADAVLAGRRDLGPEGQILGQVVHLGAVAGLGLTRPLVDALDRDRVFARADRRRSL